MCTYRLINACTSIDIDLPQLLCGERSALALLHFKCFLKIKYVCVNVHV